MTDLLPARYALGGLPPKVVIHEVGPRDGLQNEPKPLATASKVDFIGRLAAAGLSRIEVTSLVDPERVPALADGAEVLKNIDRAKGVAYSALVPNERGLLQAIENGVDAIAVFASATESFSKANLHRTIAESMVMFAPVVAKAKAESIATRGYLSMCFGDPWEGNVPLAQVVAVAKQLMDLGCDELSLGDTTGVATPGHVVALIEALGEADVSPAQVAVHFHDTYGQALANTFVALRAGVTTVDSSAGGLGGCPFAKSATGNLATEDLVFQLDGLGIHTGINLRALVDTSTWLAQQLGRPSPSRVVQAMTKPIGNT